MMKFYNARKMIDVRNRYISPIQFISMFVVGHRTIYVYGFSRMLYEWFKMC